MAREREHDNLRAVLRWLLDQAGPDGSDAAAERAAGLRPAGALERLEDAGDAQIAGFAHCYLGVLAWKRGELPSAVAHVRAGVRTSVTLRDRLVLCLGAQATAVLVGARTESPRRARL